MPPSDRQVIAVVCGGPSAEAEVSRASGHGVAQALRATFPDVLLLELDRTIGDALKENRVDVVFPVLHGPPGEDGTFQGFLETFGLPYVGSGVHASACAMDKTVAKHLFRDEGLPVAQDLIVTRGGDLRAATREIIRRLGTHVAVKPSRQGSAVGVALPNSAEAIEGALKEALSYDERILVEEFITGKEITVGLIERDGLEAFPVIEVRTPPDTWYDFEHRYTPGFSTHIIPADLPEGRYLRTQELARMAHSVLGCRDLSRVDFIVPERGEPVLLEVNTLPGMTPTSLYPDAAQAAGLSFEALVALLVEGALSRGA